MAFVDWLKHCALPVWAERGFDSARGWFHERLDWSGAPLDVPRRSMVQARQIYVYAEAARLGWLDTGVELAERAMASMLRDFATSTHRAVAIRYATGGTGAEASDSYGHAFVLLATAALHRIAPSKEHVALANGVLAHVDACLLDQEFGGLFDTYPSHSLAKRQNPIMHFVEALLALDAAMPGGNHLDRAASLVALVKDRMCCRHSGAICEHFARDWSDHPDPSMVGLVEPGHLFEWIWLLDQLEKRTARDEGATIAAFHAAANPGVRSNACIVDAIRAPHLAVTLPDHRLWPHAEALKAASVFERRGTKLRFTRDQYAGVLLDRFCGAPFAGGWIDRIDASGRPTVSDVPASTLYHLMSAGVEAAKWMDAQTVSCSGALREQRA